MFCAARHNIARNQRRGGIARRASSEWHRGVAQQLKCVCARRGMARRMARGWRRRRRVGARINARKAAKRRAGKTRVSVSGGVSALAHRKTRRTGGEEISAKAARRENQ